MKAEALDSSANTLLARGSSSSVVVVVVEARTTGRIVGACLVADTFNKLTKAIQKLLFQNPNVLFVNKENRNTSALNVESPTAVSLVAVNTKSSVLELHKQKKHPIKTRETASTYRIIPCL